MAGSDDHVSSFITKLYNPYEMIGLARQYKAYLDKFLIEFGAYYQVHIKIGLRKLAVSIVNTHIEMPIAVTIWLKYDNATLLFYPLDSTLIQFVRNHLMLQTRDLEINYPYDPLIYSDP